MTCTLATIMTFLSSGPASAHAIARALHCRPEQVCAEIANALNGWWLVESISGPEGVLYRVRPVVDSKRVQFPKPKEYNDDYISKGGFGRMGREVVK